MAEQPSRGQLFASPVLPVSDMMISRDKLSVFTQLGKERDLD